MTWVRLDDGFAEHPKVARLSDAAFRLHVRALCYAARFGTDGVVSLELFARNARPKVRRELIESGLWTECESGIEIHDFLDYNPSRSAVMAEREAARLRLQRFRERKRNAVSERDGNGVDSPSPARPVPVVVDLDSVSLASKYLGRLRGDAPRVFGGLGDEDVFEIAAEYGIAPPAASRMVADVWEWWRTAPSSRRWRDGRRGWRTWCRREAERMPKTAANGSGPAAPSSPVCPSCGVPTDLGHAEDCPVVVSAKGGGR